MKRFATYISAVLLAISCSDTLLHEEFLPDDKVEEESTSGEISICTRLIDASAPGSKSILPEKTIEDMITGITIAAYYKGGLLADKKHYTSGFSDMTLSVNKSEEYDIYAAVNMGDVTSQLPVKESDISAMQYTLPSYAEVERSGIPMCGILKDVTYDNSRKVIPVERLFAKLRVRITHAGLENSSADALYAYNMCNKSLYVRQANRRLFPFSAEGSRAVSSSDILGQSDYNPDMNNRSEYEGPLSQSQLGPGPGYFQDTTLVFYIPENMQGKLLPGNEDPFGKTPESISQLNGNDYSGICTYIEFNGKREKTSAGYGGSITYRYYIGSDSTTDFNVKRNCVYDMTLKFSEEGFFMESWKVTRGDDWTDTRSLKFIGGPFTIYKGQEQKVMVHYHPAAATGNSLPDPDKWDYVFDDEAMTGAGLSYTFDRNTLVTGSNGYKDFCFVFKASESAKAGSGFPLKIVSKDRTLSDFSTICISEMGDMQAVWDFCPMYVSQEGTLTISGVPESKLPVRVSLSDASKLQCNALSATSFKIVATGAGDTRMILSNNDGSQTLAVNLHIQAPVLKVSDTRLQVNPDGASASTGYRYADNTGETLQNVNPAAYSKYLKPVVTGDSYFSANPGESDIEIFINRLYDNSGRQIALGESHPLSIAASMCTEVVPVRMSLFVVDPFEGIAAKEYGKIDDYTLLYASSVHRKIKEYFEEELSAPETSLDAPVPNADPKYVTAELTPRWMNEFSNPNEIFSIKYETGVPESASNAMFRITSRTPDTNTRHSAGRHDIMLKITNRHSSESIAESIGTMEVYIHTVIGATAEFGSEEGGYRPNTYSPTFAAVYNSIMVNSPFSDTHPYIYYMDVTVRHLTNVGGVLLFQKMSSAAKQKQNLFDCLDIARPSVSDKTTMHNCLLYSVYEETGGDRITTGGEPYGSRSGIGDMLYRALLYPGKSASLSETALKTSMLGYNPLGKNNMKYAPRYEIHDMSKSSSMTDNIISRNAPYYFAPSGYPQYRDKNGKGYHVIHFIDQIDPESCGWTNLL